MLLYKLTEIQLKQRLLDLSGNPIPDEYDPCRLILLSRHQVAFWYETHPKVVISTRKIKNLKNKKVELKFAQNEEGIFNFTIYRYAKPLGKIASVMYDDKICICKGVASVKMPCGNIEGRSAELIDYNRKVSEEEFNKKIQYEIAYMKKNSGKKWTTFTYPVGYSSDRIFENDSPIVFKQIGIALSERLQKERNLTIVKNLLMRKEKNDTELKLLKVKGLSIKFLKKLSSNLNKQYQVVGCRKLL